MGFAYSCVKTKKSYIIDMDTIGQVYLPITKFELWAEKIKALLKEEYCTIST